MLALRYRPAHLVAVGTVLALSLAARAWAAAPIALDPTIVVSLDANPRDPAEIARYEAILREFAEIVYDATEGQHEIETIEVYRGGARRDVADVVWQLQGHPKAALNGRRGPGQLYMADVFTGGATDGGDLPLVDEVAIGAHPDFPLLGANSAAAVLAHEWGHYAYGLLDEHVIAPGDVAVASTLMSSPWNAAPSASSWRNLSVAGDGLPPFEDFENTLATAHHRAYGRSAWELIGEAPAPGAELVAPIPGRLARDPYSELIALPTVTLPVTQSLGSPSPTVVEWRDCSTYVVAVDRSGSMTGLPLLAAKTVAGFVLDQLGSDVTTLSLVAFGSVADVEIDRLLVSDDDSSGMTSRELVRDEIDRIAARPQSTSYAAALGAAGSLFGPSAACPAATKALFLISDGTNSDTPTDLDTAISSFQQSTGEIIPIYAIDVGPFIAGAAPNDMATLATSSGGIQIQSVLAPSNAAIQAVAEADAPLRTRHGLGRASASVPAAGSGNLLSFTVDPTLERIRVCARAPDDVGTLFLSSPSTTIPGLAARRSDPADPDDDCSFFWAQSLPEPGVWTVAVSGAPASGAVVDIEAEGQSSGGGVTLRAWVSNESSSLTYTEPIHVSASLFQDRPIVGARVEASLDGGPPVRLRDDGLRPDALPNDGIYVGSLLVDASCADPTTGCNSIRVEARERPGLVARSSDGLVLAPGIQGNLLAGEARSPIAFAFRRIVEIEGPATDATPPPPIVTITGTTAVSGRIDGPGQTDVYEISALAGPGEIRVSGALLGMRPTLRVFAPNGDLVGEATAAPGVGGVAVPADFDVGTLTARVSHASAGTGTYQISAGPVLNLPFGAAGSADTPCDVATQNKYDALAVLESGLPGVPAARLLIGESNDLEHLMVMGINELADRSSRQKKARKLLRKAVTRDKKALRRMNRAEIKARPKELSGARRKIRNALRKLAKACGRLPDGGASLVP